MISIICDVLFYFCLYIMIDDVLSVEYTDAQKASEAGKYDDMHNECYD